VVKKLCDIIKFGMLQVRENEILLRKWTGGTAQLPSSQGTLAAKQVLLDVRRALTSWCEYTQA